ncbi:MAG: hypothetical protein O2888_04525, partial [Chloroflexi bacterium]|nr:hypothetical protein [Chloroflexota bacterium]
MTDELDSRMGADLAAEVAGRVASLDRTNAFRTIALNTSVDPRLLLADPVAAGVTASYERPDQGFALVGIGTTHRIEVPEGRGPASVRDDVRRLFEAPVEGDAPGLRPRLLGGFRFNPEAEPDEPWTAFGPG